MTVILDECLLKRLTKLFDSHRCWTVPQIGLAGRTDRELLDALDRKEVDVFITIDGNIEYQQQFHHRKFGTIVLRSPSNRFDDLKHLAEHFEKVIETIQPGQVVHLP